MATKDKMTNIPSPCVRNCCLDKNDICLGCHRSLEEIVQWSQCDDKQKKTILAAVQRRKPPLQEQ